mmetsp:Transcript_61978/g.134338  ORF Transcript_61978/g.134338 Transcript_61978/m.134338 type:complete len:236 (+) Transcript_61978:1549-2256(+)
MQSSRSAHARPATTRALMPSTQPKQTRDSQPRCGSRSDCKAQQRQSSTQILSLSATRGRRGSPVFGRCREEFPTAAVSARSPLGAAGAVEEAAGAEPMRNASARPSLSSCSLPCADTFDSSLVLLPLKLQPGESSFRMLLEQQREGTWLMPSLNETLRAISKLMMCLSPKLPAQWKSASCSPAYCVGRNEPSPLHETQKARALWTTSVTFQARKKQKTWKQAAPESMEDADTKAS